MGCKKNYTLMWIAYLIGVLLPARPAAAGSSGNAPCGSNF